MDQKSIANLITQLFILNFAKIFVFQAVTTGYIKTYQSKKITKVKLLKVKHLIGL